MTRIPASPASSENERRRWLHLLGLEFAAAAAFIVAVFGSGDRWFLLPALVCGPAAALLSVVYLAISSDTNEQPALAAEAPRWPSDRHGSGLQNLAGRVASTLRRRAVSLARVRVTRRGLQIALGLLWLLDGGLQLQPFMLGDGFARQVIAPAAAGQPHLVAAPVTWAASVIAGHPVAWDVAFASVQLLLGLGMLVPRTTRLALAASLPWVLGVWFFGEGLGGLAGGQASLLTGAPGSVLLYGVLALAAWPRRGHSNLPPARWLPLAWAALWLGGAVLQALPTQNTGPAVAGTILDAADGAPHWLAHLDSTVAGWIAHQGSAVVVALLAAEVLIGLAALSRRTVRFAVAVGLLASLAIWIVGQSLGQLSTGQATDPNTAPLVALMAFTLLADRQRRRRGNALEKEGFQTVSFEMEARDDRESGNARDRIGAGQAVFGSARGFMREMGRTSCSHSVTRRRAPPEGEDDYGSGSFSRRHSMPAKLHSQEGSNHVQTL